MPDSGPTWLARFVAGLPATTVLIGADDGILATSPRARARFGDAARFEDLLAGPADRPRLLERARRQPGKVHDEAVALRSVGPSRAATLRLLALAGEDDVVAVWFAAEDEVAGDRERLVNDVAHALRNAIFAATMQCDALVMRLGDQPDLARAVTFISQQVQRLDDTLDEMLLYGRPVRLAVRRIDATALLRGVIDDYRAGTRREPAEIAADLPSAPIDVMWDEDAARTAVERLLDNAVVFTPPPHRVRCALERDGDAVVITVEDRGRGIAADILPRAFEPFFPQHGGRPGLGLAVAAKMVRALGGAITLDPAEPTGVVARCRIPVSATAGD